MWLEPTKKSAIAWPVLVSHTLALTKQGATRIASSAVWKGADLLDQYGIKHLEYHVVLCAKRPGVESWEKLERALLIRFQQLYGDIPKANRQGSKIRPKDEQRYFSQDRLDKIITDLS